MAWDGAGTAGVGMLDGTTGVGMLDGIIGDIPTMVFGTLFILTTGTCPFGEDMDLSNPITVKI